MKLSEMKTEEHIDQLMDLIDVLDEISTDKEFISQLSKILPELMDEKLTNVQVAMKLWQNKKIIIKLLLKDKFEETIKLISILSEKTVDQLKSQAMMITVVDAYKCLNDKELWDFFKQQGESTNSTSSSSLQKQD